MNHLRKTMGRVLAGLGLALSWIPLTRADAPPAPSPVNLNWSGWTQLRYNNFDPKGPAAGQDEEFQIKRSRLKYSGVFDRQRDSMELQIDIAKLADQQSNADSSFGRRVVLKGAWVAHPFNMESTARLGLANIPWGIEVDKGDDWRLDFERSHVADAFFPDQKEVGLYYLFTPATGSAPSWMPEFAAGYTNGQVDWGNASSTTYTVLSPTGAPIGTGSAITANDTRDFAAVARAKWHLPLGGEASISYITARRDHWSGFNTTTNAQNPAVWENQNCWTPAVRFCTPLHLNVMAEYYQGKILNADNNGGYAQLDYTPGVGQATPFVRWEQWNDPGKAHVNDYQQDTFGVALNTNEKVRYTVEWDKIKDNNGSSYNNFGLQWQFAYGGK